MRITRRETLATLLGLPIVLTSGCGGPSRTPLPPGQLVGAADKVGHRLRDRNNWSRPKESNDTSVVIVGGGMAGLAAARRLSRAGVEDYVILELEDKVGGTSRSGESPLVSYPWGAHYVPAPRKENRALVALLNEMDVLRGQDESGDPKVAEQFLCRDPQERIFYKGEWYEGLFLHDLADAEDQHQWKRFGEEMKKWAQWRDGAGRPAFTIPMAHSSDDSVVRQLDQLSMAQWLDEHKFQSAKLRWYVDYACRDDYGLKLEQTSAWAGIFYFVARVGNNGQPRPFVTWPEGNGRIVAHLRTGAQAKIRTDRMVVQIEPLPEDESSEAKCRVLAATGSDGTMEEYRCTRVVFAAPHFLVPYVIPSLRAEAKYVSEFQYGAWAVVNIQLAKMPASKGFPLAWDNVLYDSPSLGYVSATYQRGLDYDQQHVTYYYPLTDDDPKVARQKLLDTDREGWADTALTDLGRAHSDIRELAQRADVMRWGHAMVQPRPGFVWGEARRKAAEPRRGIYFAHSDLSGLALFEEAFYRGTLAAEQVLLSLGKEVQSVL